MPFGEAPPKVPQEQAPKNLIEQGRELLDILAVELPKLPIAEREILIQRVAIHSIEDGIRLAGQIPGVHNENIFYTHDKKLLPEIKLRHAAFIRAIQIPNTSHYSELSPQERSQADEWLVFDPHLSSAKRNFEAQSSFKMNLELRSNEMIKRIDDFYTKLLQQRELAERGAQAKKHEWKSEKKESDTESRIRPAYDLAMEALSRANDMFKHSIYGVTAREILESIVKHPDFESVAKNSLSESQYRTLFFEEYIPQKDIEEMAESLAFLVEEERMSLHEKLEKNRYRPLDPVYKAGLTAARTNLIKEISVKIKNPKYKLQLDAHGEYVISDRDAVQDKEGVRVKILLEFELKNQGVFDLTLDSTGSSIFRYFDERGAQIIGVSALRKIPIKSSVYRVQQMPSGMMYFRRDEDMNTIISTPYGDFNLLPNSKLSFTKDSCVAWDSVDNISQVFLEEGMLEVSVKSDCPPVVVNSDTYYVQGKKVFRYDLAMRNREKTIGSYDIVGPMKGDLSGEVCYYLAVLPGEDNWSLFKNGIAEAYLPIKKETEPDLHVSGGKAFVEYVEYKEKLVRKIWSQNGQSDDVKNNLFVRDVFGIVDGRLLYSTVDGLFHGDIFIDGSFDHGEVVITSDTFFVVEITDPVAGNYKIISGDGWSSEEYINCSSLKIQKVGGSIRGCAIKKVGASLSQIQEFELEINESGKTFPELQSELELLNTVVHPTRDRVCGYVEKTQTRRRVIDASTVGGVLSRAKEFALGVSEMLRENEKGVTHQQLLKTMAAKPDPTDPETVRELARIILPQLFPKKEEKRSSGSWFSRLWTKSPQAPSAAAYLKSHDTVALQGGDPKAEGKDSSAQVLEMREASQEFIVTNLVDFAHDGSVKTVELPLSPDLSGEVSEFTFKLSVPKGMRKIKLPQRAGAQLILDRIKGIGSTGEVLLEAVSKGYCSVVQVPEGITSIVYSMRRAVAPSVAREVSQSEYTVMAHRLNDQDEEKLSCEIFPLTPEIAAFIRATKEKPPAERIAAVEEYVRQIGYYDFNNGNVMDTKKDMSPKNLVAFLRKRMEEVRRQKPELSGEMKGKMFAGVCLDFAVVTAGLLRACGIRAGVATGFRPNGVRVSTAEAHAVTFVPWPGEKNGEMVMITADGTPGGLLAEEKKKLAHIQMPTQQQKSEPVTAPEDSLDKKALEELRKIELVIQSQNAEQIALLTNGQLEKTLNVILRQDVGVKTIAAALDMMWYTPFALDKIDLDDPSQLKEMVEFVHNQFRYAHVASKLRSYKEADDEKEYGGTRMMSLVMEFAQKYAAHRQGSTRIEAYHKLEIVFRQIEHELTPNETRAISAILAYLTARQMMKK